MQGKNGKTKRLSVKDNRLKSRKPKAETPPQIIKYRDDSTRQQFRERHGEPDAGDPGHTGQQQESGNQKDEASKQSERSGGSYPFKTLIIPDDGQVHDEKTKPDANNGNPSIAIRAAGVSVSRKNPTNIRGQQTNNPIAVIPHTTAVANAIRRACITRPEAPAPKL